MTFPASNHLRLVYDEIELPNIRKAFVPDPGMTIVDADLAGADAQVVAWEAGDLELMEAFRAGLDVHSMNLEAMWGVRPENTDKVAFKNKRRDCKQGVHLSNYGGTSRTLAKVLGWTVHQSEQFQRRWFSIHPRIKTHFQGNVMKELQTSRTTTNRLGFTRTWFDRIDNVYTEALAWTPQSTVAIVANKGAMQVEDKFPFIEFLLQVHDSIVFQMPTALIESHLPSIAETFRVPIPYSDPLTIRWDIKHSAKSWGDCG